MMDDILRRAFLILISKATIRKRPKAVIDRIHNVFVVINNKEGDKDSTVQITAPDVIAKKVCGKEDPRDLIAVV